MRTVLWIGLCLLLPGAFARANADTKLSVPRADGAETPLRVYAANDAACAPLALLSPGAGGDENGLRYLAEALSADGWRAIVIGHRESGPAALRADIRNAHGLRRGVTAMVDDADDYRGRLLDIDAARQWAQRICKAPFTALLGHSMGARTVQLEAGAHNRLGVYAQGGFDAYVALSPAGPDAMFPADAERDIHAPMLMITGTRDDGLDGDYHWRTQAFDALGQGCHWLAVIDGSTHMNLAGAGMAGKTEAATIGLVAHWLDARRAGRCERPQAQAGVTIR